MDASLDLSRWNAAPRGVGYRRWTIVSAGLRQLFQLRFFKALVAVAAAGAIGLAALGFLFSQSVTTGGWLETTAGYIGPRAQAFFSVVAALVLLYPDVCIDGWFTLIFWLHSYLGLGLSLVALTTLVPRLITRDRATNALTVYLSRPLTSADYLLGKLGTIVGVLVIMWTGPLLFGWLLSVAFAPNRDFIVYSISPLLRALLFHGIALVALAAIAFGVSAIGKTSRTTVIVWIGIWLLLGAVAKPPRSPQWLKRASFTHNLGEVRQGVFELDRALLTAADALPLTDKGFVQNLQRGGNRARSDDFNGALASLGVFVALSSVVFLRRLKAE